MRRAEKALVLIAVMAAVGAPTQARAEGYVSPWAGVNFGNSSAEGKRTLGLNLGFMGAGVIGAEFGLGFAPNFFGESVDNNVMDVMGNLIIGVPVGGTRGPGLRPYVTGGLGVIRTSIDPGSNAPSLDTNDFGYNLGGGVMGYFTDHIGLRADARYLRTLNKDGSSNSLDVDLGSFHFWRGTVGLVIR